MASAYYSNTQQIDFESVLAMDDPVVKKKRTMKKKSGSSKVNLEIVVVAHEAVPIQMVESSTAAPAAEGIFAQPAAEDEIPADPPADEVAGVTVDEVAADAGANEGTTDDNSTRVNEPTSEPAVADIVNEEPSTADEVDDIIEQVLADTAQIIVDEEDQVVRTSGEGNQPAGTAEERHWFDLPYDDLIARWDAERPVVTASDTDEEVESMDVGAAGGDQEVQFSVEEPEDMEMNDELIDADEKMSLDEIILTIPAELPLPSSEREVTKITIGTEIKIPGVDEKTWYLDSLPQIPVDNKGKEPLQLIDPIKGKPPQENYYLICADINLLVQLREKIIDEDVLERYLAGVLAPGSDQFHRETGTSTIGGGSSPNPVHDWNHGSFATANGGGTAARVARLRPRGVWEKGGLAATSVGFVMQECFPCSPRSSITILMMGLNRPNGPGSGPVPYEHSVHFHHRGFIIIPIADQIGPIYSVHKTEHYDAKTIFHTT
ncbi:putative receptor-like protein kinase [Dorcoceras hygrometricum]|uniref:Putative receptor-like protein kinase n=1 Tax=Dorcoceras hygrometricum TaxID=472368 RepID=A0A2Z7C1B9_9LAMI|nr:putative receptor-like protein kinase [Dorcoceras hygrometricum]